MQQNGLKITLPGLIKITQTDKGDKRWDEDLECD